MINFEYVEWKNFLSTGDQPTRLELDREPTTLIVGNNGAGKSTLLDALSFALFGKPHRDVKKVQLINTINNKQTLVECGFRIGSHKFVIVRGMKPNRFEIYQNEVLINQSSDARDYQKFLEQNILKLNHKSFHQIVVLGSSSFVPFMQLKSNYRREVIEDLLDIRVFTTMNVVVKERLSTLREVMRDLDHQIDLNRTKMDMQQKLIRNLTAIAEGQNEQIDSQIKHVNSQIDKLSEKDAEFDSNLLERRDAAQQALNRLVSKQQRLRDIDNEFKSKIKQLVKLTKFYQDNDSCPSCEQPLGADLKKSKYDTSAQKAKKLQTGREEISVKMTDMSERATQLSQQISDLDELIRQQLNNRSEISRLQNTRLQLEKGRPKGNVADLKTANDEYTKLRAESQSLTKQKVKHSEDKTYYDAVAEMLRDTGIKTKIIKQYLPVMNNLINHYLQVLDFFVSFHLDESFQEEIKSRHRDTFNYASFSEGEKMKIDLALLFTWRKIASMKNSASTNLLVLDETFDSSLDNDGIENLMKIIDSLEADTNVIIISHKRDILESKFENVVEFVKTKNFSSIKGKES